MCGGQGIQLKVIICRRTEIEIIKLAEQDGGLFNLSKSINVLKLLHNHEFKAGFNL